MSGTADPMPRPRSTTPAADGDIVLAIHHRVESFSDRWRACCEERGITARIVDGYASDIIEQLQTCDGFLWHFDHEEGTDLLMARHVLSAAEYAGLAVFPDRHTAWHFDDKLAQKYVLEAVGAPLVPTWAFYDERRGRAWLGGATLPLVRKLRRGAGSANVGLVRSLDEARRYLRAMFGRGVRPVSGYFTDVGVRVASTRTRAEALDKLRRAPQAIRTRWRKRAGVQRERGYALFQEFQPGNEFDTRIIVVGGRAWSYRRRVRRNDFRASGSRNVDFDPAPVNPECVRIAFAVNDALQSQSTAFDFVHAPDGRPLITEISYGFNHEAVWQVSGQWDRALRWHAGNARAEDAILDGVLARIRERRARIPEPADHQAGNQRDAANVT
jgi:glutathione synthase/RimK-type ligase-like ATP-grasp enzyme